MGPAVDGGTTTSDCEALAMAIGYSLNVQRIPEGILREQSETALADAQDNEIMSKV